jgi:hypothetical protein
LARRRLAWRRPGLVGPRCRWRFGRWDAPRSAVRYGYGYGPYGYGGYGGCTSYAPIYDAYGNYIGQQLVNGC